jgi:hypothetical protein
MHFMIGMTLAFIYTYWFVDRLAGASWLQGGRMRPAPVARDDGYHHADVAYDEPVGGEDAVRVLRDEHGR